MNTDTVDRMLAQWAQVMPGAASPEAAAAKRIALLAGHLRRATDTAVRPLGLDAGLFEVLATLLRSGPPFQLSPTELARTLAVSSSAMTKRLDALEAKSLISRVPERSDRRAMHARLTDSGRDTAVASITAQASAQKPMLERSGVDLPALNEELRKLLRSIENSL